MRRVADEHVASPHMLKRTLTAAILLALLLPSIFWLPAFLFVPLLLSAFVGVAAWEWGGFFTHLPSWRISYALFVTGFFYLLLYLSSLIIVIVTILWVFAVIRVLNHGNPAQSPLRIASLGAFMIPGCAITLDSLRNQSIELLLIVLVTVWAGDILGLLVGKNFGKNKLIPEVSPNKTWEGLYAAIAGAIVIAFVLHLGWGFPLLKMMGVLILTVLMSVIGDLFISCYKRQRGLDDTGSILPGHGGLLDRVDGLLAAAPVYFCLLMVTGLWKV